MSVTRFLRNLGRLARSDVQTVTTATMAAPASLAGSVSAGLQVPGSGTPAESTILAFACITARREAIGGAPLMVTDAENNEIESGPLRELLARPNAETEWDGWVRQVETHLTLYNLAAIYPVREGVGGQPDALDLLHPAGLTVDVAAYSPTGTPRVWKYRYTDPTTAEQREFERDALILYRGYNPHAPMTALAPINVLKRTVLADICAREQNLGLFLNDATPRGYLHTDLPMTKPQAEEVLDVWNAMQRGYANRHKTAALWGGLKYDRLQLSPAELEFLESLKGLRIDFYMAFRVYPAMLAEMTGETGLSQGSSTESQRVAWWEDVGIPELDLIAGLHQRVADLFGTRDATARRRALSRGERWTLERRNLRRATANGGAVRVWFNDSAIAPLARARIGRIDSAVKLNALGYEPDAVSEYLGLGLPPHPDNLPRVPFSLTTLTGPEQPAAGKRPLEAAERADFFGRLNRIEELARAEGEKIAAGQKRFLQYVAPLERKAAERWSRFFVEQRARVLSRLRPRATAAKAEGGLLRADATAAGGATIEEVFPRAEENAQLLARLTPIWTEQLRAGREYFERETGVELRPFEVDDPDVLRAVEARKIQGLKVNETTEETLRGIFRESLEAGEDLATVAEKIADYYRANAVGPDKVRPLTAARTQTAGIVNDGRLLGAREVGGLLKFWRHGGSEEPRPTHLAAAARYDEANAIALDQKFEVDGELMDAPGDPGADVRNTANCSCSLGFAKERR